jgi:hypothetical protein
MKRICKKQIVSKNLGITYTVTWDSAEKIVWINYNGGELQVGSNCQTEKSAITTAHRLIDPQPYH